MSSLFSNLSSKLGLSHDDRTKEQTTVTSKKTVESNQDLSRDYSPMGATPDARQSPDLHRDVERLDLSTANKKFTQEKVRTTEVVVTNESLATPARMEAHREEALSSLRRANQELNSASAAVDQQESKIATLGSELEALRKAAEGLEAGSGTAQAQLSAIKTQLAEAKRQMELLNADLKSTATRLAARDADVSRLNEELTQLKATLQSRIDELERVKRESQLEIERLRRESADEKEQIEATSGKALSTLQEAHEKELQELRATSDRDLAAKERALTEKFTAEIDAERAARVKAVEQLEAKLRAAESALQREKESLAAQIDQLRREKEVAITSIRAELNDAIEGEKAKLVAERESFEARRQELSARIADLEKQLKDAQTEQARLLTEKDREIAAMRSQQAKAFEELNASLKAQYEGIISTLSTDFTTEMGKRLLAQKAASDKLLENLQAKLIAAEHTNDAERLRWSETIAQLKKEQDFDLAALRAELSKAIEDERAKLAIERDAFAKERSGLNLRIADLEEQLKAARLDCTTLTTTIETHTKEMNAERLEHAKEIERLNGSLKAQCEAMQRDIAKNADALESRLESMSTQCTVKADAATRTQVDLSERRTATQETIKTSSKIDARRTID